MKTSRAVVEAMLATIPLPAYEQIVKLLAALESLPPHVGESLFAALIMTGDLAKAMDVEVGSIPEATLVIARETIAYLKRVQEKTS